VRRQRNENVSWTRKGTCRLRRRSYDRVASNTLHSIALPYDHSTSTFPFANMTTSQIIQLNTYTLQISSIVQCLTSKNARIDNAQTRNQQIIRRTYLKAVIGLLALVSPNLRATRELLRRYGQAVTLAQMRNVHPNSVEQKGWESVLTWRCLRWV
jgi:hypothetical protein